MEANVVENMAVKKMEQYTHKAIENRASRNTKYSYEVDITKQTVTKTNAKQDDRSEV